MVFINNMKTNYYLSTSTFHILDREEKIMLYLKWKQQQKKILALNDTLFNVQDTE